YLLKPFDDERVVATVKRAEDFLEWARREDAAGPAPVLRGFGAVSVDFSQHLVKRGGKAVDLRPKEYALLVALLKRGGRVASRVYLVRAAGGYAVGGKSAHCAQHA